MKPVFAFLILTTTFAQGDESSWKNASIENQKLLDVAWDETLKLVERYPPDKYFIVNLGSNTAVQSAILDHLFEGGSDYFREVNLQGTGMLSTDGSQLYRLLDVILPNEAELRGRKIVINRALYLGTSMKVMIPKMLAYADSHGLSERIEFNFYTANLETAEELRARLRDINESKALKNIHFVNNPYFAETTVSRSLGYKPRRGDILFHARYEVVEYTDFGQMRNDLHKQNPNYRELQQRIAASAPKKKFSSRVSDWIARHLPKSIRQCIQNRTKPFL